MNELKSKAEWDTMRRKYEVRHKHTQETAWFILTDEVANILGTYLKGLKVVEVFAGTGYLAHHLRKRAGLTRHEYKAYDNQSSYRMTGRYPGVTKKNAFMAPIKKADVVIMTWPPYDTNDAARVVKKMRAGQVLIYNGESWGGCTGDDEFFSVLEDQFQPLTPTLNALDDVHVRFQGINDYWGVYIKTN